MKTEILEEMTEAMKFESSLETTKYLSTDMEDRCKHGRYVGNAFTADFMCGDCELGTSDEVYEMSCEIAQLKELVRQYKFIAVRAMSENWKEEICPVR